MRDFNFLNGFCLQLTFFEIFYILKALQMFLQIKFRDSSMVEHAAVNRRVVGSSPTRGAKGTRCANHLVFFYVFPGPLQYVISPNLNF
jgi:hypothetical protein